MKRALVLAATVALGGARTAHASPEDIFGYGGRTSAMGATGAAHAQGYESAFHNPALASTVRDNKLTLGFSGAHFRLDAEGAGLPGRTSTSPATGTIIGAEVPVPLGGFLARRIGLALAFYTPTDVVVRGRVLYPERAQFPILGDRAKSVALRAGFGVDVGWGVRVGAGFAALAELAGTVVAATDATGRVGTRVETQLVATYAPTLGLTYDLPLRGDATYRVGLNYRGTLDARFGITIDASKISSLQIPLFNISGVAQYDPSQFVVEAARIEGLGVLAAQFVYKRWSAFPGILEPTVLCLDGSATCGLLPPSIDWQDTFVGRLGAEQGFRVAPGAVMRGRAGAFYETSPLPKDLPAALAFDASAKGAVAVPVRYFDAHRLAGTLGVGLSLSKPLPPIDLDLFGQYQVLLPRTIRSLDDQGAVLAEGKASGHVASFGMTAGVRF